MCCCSNPFYDIKKSAIIFFILLDFFTEKYTAVIWPAHFRYGVKHYLINQSINQKNTYLSLKI